MLTHKGTVTLITPRLKLRQLIVDDAQVMYKNWASDEKVTKYLSWDIHKSIKATSELLAKWVVEYEKLNYYHWVIELSGTIIGTINFHSISDKDEHCEMGYCIGSKWWNKGFVTEAVAEMIRFAFEELNANKVCALHDTDNVASGRIMQKNGMKQEGLLREHKMRKDGTRGDLAYYSILKDEWTANKA
ncbi:MAG: GNAT family N-acetyltransferase [Eubacteriales bacterium]|nr:GNAT family N-acetyltransferase [Eubacteriales bacterium]